MDLDELARSAANRGLKLRRSRVRTPGKGDYGKVGLADPSGKPVFGIDGKSLSATPEEVQAYLRKLGSNDWNASLSEPGRPHPRPKRKAAANDDSKSAPRKPPAKPRPLPVPEVRKAKPGDSRSVAALLRQLGYDPDGSALGKRLAQLIRSGDPPLVATIGKAIVGLCGIQVSTMLQREAPVGRITVLVVSQDQRGKGLGRMLVTAAEERFGKAGCKLVEVTSNDRHLGAHAFYRRMGYERTSIRFAKSL